MEIKRGDIWYIESGYSTGSEQRPGRPAVVVSNDLNNVHSTTVEVVYLTTQPKRDLPTHATIHSMSRDSIAICEQITTVAVERIGNYRGCVTDAEMEDIEATMQVSLGLREAEAVCINAPPPRAGNQTRGGRSEVRGSATDVRFPVKPTYQSRVRIKARVA